MERLVIMLVSNWLSGCSGAGITDGLDLEGREAKQLGLMSIEKWVLTRVLQKRHFLSLSGGDSC